MRPPGTGTRWGWHGFSCWPFSPWASNAGLRPRPRRAYAGRCGNGERVLLLEFEVLSFGVCDLPHHGAQLAGIHVEYQKVIDGESPVPVEVRVAPIEQRIRFGPASARHHVLDPVPFKSLVVVNVPVQYQHPGVQAGKVRLED